MIKQRAHLEQFVLLTDGYSLAGVIASKNKRGLVAYSAIPNVFVKKIKG